MDTTPPQVDLAAISTPRIYHRTGDRDLVLHWCPCRRSRAPVVVFFHGGGWHKGSPTQFAWQCKDLAERNLASTATVQYRLRGDDATDAWDCVADAKAALRWLRAHHVDLGIDPHRLCAAGGSAGGHLALATAMIDPEADDADTATSCVPNLLFTYNPVVDTGPGTRFASAFGARCEDASPLHQVRPGLPETMIVQGSADTTTPLETAQRFAEAMETAGNRCTVAPYAGGEHGFYRFPPHLWATQALLSDTLARVGWA